jgi:LCP family protein required for cell wall assembly
MARLKARRSRYRFTTRLAGSVPAAVITVLLLLTIGGTSLFAARVIGFLNHVTGGGVSVSTITNAVGITEAPAGSIPYRIKHKDPNPINLLVLGYGGSENDAPYLSDTIMVVRLDPASGRVAMLSVPRDLYVSIPAWPDSSGISEKEKINAAFEIGTDESNFVDNNQKLPQFRGRDGGGHLAEETISRVTGLHLDRYAAVDFKAFRDVVNALGGVDVCLDTNLDDNHYPDYHNGYVPGGIHFKAGCQHVDGESALRLARSPSRTATSAAPAASSRSSPRSRSRPSPPTGSARRRA